MLKTSMLLIKTLTINYSLHLGHSLKQGAVILTLIFTVMMGVTKAGWGASTPYGMWFGKFLMLFGVSADSLAEFTKMAPEFYSNPLLENGVSVQNFGILFGTIIFLLTSGQFKRTFMSEMNLTGKEALLYALGGICMGFGTRLSNGCNVGALYTPIANFSLSGWIFLIPLVIGAILGNKFSDKWYGK
ncbi:YeeE/YedE thiosulfate transporter family protein [Vagococcus lutrae]|uniref:YeeE/YedE thiosulfate transporter family protein n=1 Tax=Vagococcus lutrae TaxID=81947 RepID=UPI002892E8B8|nr:YeeE/YedE thiosulfate transporter family protein [Vagococcus lutrae]